MKRVFFLLIIAAAGVGAYMYFSGDAATENGPDKPQPPKEAPKPAYVIKFESKDYAGALKTLEALLGKDAAAEGADGCYIAARSALELGELEKARTYGDILIEKFRKDPQGQTRSLELGEIFHARFVGGDQADRNYWVTTRDLLGVGLYSAGPQVQAVIAKLNKLNEIIEFSHQRLAGTVTYRVVRGDTLAGIADKYETNWSMIMRINRLKKPDIQIGDVLKVIPGGQFHIMIEKGKFMMTVYRDGIYIKSYKIGIGKEGEDTPTGKTRIISREITPDWYDRKHNRTVRPTDNDYPLGERWLPFDKENFASYGIHGTNEPETVGTKSSNGCIRLRNEDVIEVYDLITVGTTVLIKE